MHKSLTISVGSQNIAAALHVPEPERLSVAAPVVVCCHGLTGTRVGSCYRLVHLARRLCELNVACLRFDFRGCGESDGGFEDVSAARLSEDLRAVVRSLDHAPGCDPTRLGIVASSFGAFTTSLCAQDIPALRAAVFWAPVASPGALVERDMTPQAWAYLRQHHWIEHRGLRMGEAFFNGLTDVDAPSLLAQRRCPLLVFHGARDSHVPIAQGRAYVDAVRSLGGEAVLEELETDDHGMRSVALNDRLIEGTARWVCRFLHPEPPASTS